MLQATCLSSTIPSCLLLPILVIMYMKASSSADQLVQFEWIVVKLEVWTADRALIDQELC